MAGPKTDGALRVICMAYILLADGRASARLQEWFCVRHVSDLQPCIIVHKKNPSKDNGFELGFFLWLFSFLQSLPVFVLNVLSAALQNR